jgi:hypothetical protein
MSHKDTKNTKKIVENLAPLWEIIIHSFLKRVFGENRWTYSFDFHQDGLNTMYVVLGRFPKTITFAPNSQLFSYEIHGIRRNGALVPFEKWGARSF